MENKEKQPFQGFDIPKQNWFKLPEEFILLMKGMTSLAELKCVLYVLRHTWGYSEYGVAKKITTDEFMHGRKTSSGSRLDQGTGLSNRSVIDGLKSAVQHGYLGEEVDRRDAARIKKSYMPKMQEGELSTEPAPLDPDGAPAATDTTPNSQEALEKQWENTAMKNLQPDVKNLHIGYEESSHRTEKDTVGRKTVNRYENPSEKQQEDTVNRSKNPIEALPTLDQDEREQHATVAYILDGLGAQEHKSEKFFLLVASRIPRKIIETHLSGILYDGAKNPGALFTYRMTKYARETLEQQAHSNQKETLHSLSKGLTDSLKMPYQHF